MPFCVCSRVRTWLIALNTTSCFSLFPVSLVDFHGIPAPPHLNSTWVPGSCSVRLWLSRFGRHHKTQWLPVLLNPANFVLYTLSWSRKPLLDNCNAIHKSAVDVGSDFLPKARRSSCTSCDCCSPSSTAARLSMEKCFVHCVLSAWGTCAVLFEFTQCLAVTHSRSASRP